MIRYEELEKKLTVKLKISPVAIIPHKSRSYHKIMDLYFQIRHKGSLIKSVNSEMLKQSLAEAVIHLGQCLQ